MRTQIKTVAVAGVAALALAACTGASDEGSADGDVTISVMYMSTEGVQTIGNLFEAAKEQYEAENDGVTIDLQPVEASEDDYATQLALSHQSPETAPDVFYEDTFRVRADVAAGYLLPLDDYVAEWDDWELFIDAAKEAGRDGDSVYAIPLGTDTRGIWYSETLLEAAGVELPWQPATWQDILDTAQIIAEHDAEVVPFHIYAGQPAGEGGVMQGFLPLLYGTEDTLYDEESGSWVVGSQGFIDVLTFLQTLYDDGYSVPVDEALDANLWQRIFDDMLPNATLGGTIEGSYGASFWQEEGPFPWDGFEDEIGVAPIPTQHGQAPGSVSMSGGWTVAIGAQTEHPDEAFDFLTYVFNYENNRNYVIDAAQLSVRSDVAEDPEYLEADPYIEFFTEQVEVTHYRPATEDYPRVSAAIQEASEAVITGNATPQEAAAIYDDAVRSIVGDDGVVEAG